MNSELKSTILVLITLFYFQPLVAQHKLPEKGLCAHRGAMDTHPENTITAFEEAILLQAQMIEFDVRMTKDGKLVILHDETVDRTTDGTGKLEELKFKQVRQLDAGSWKSEKFRNEKIPTFEETLAVMPDNIWLNIHLKGDRKLGKKVAKSLKKSGKQNQAFIACGSDAAKGVSKVSSDIFICNMERQEKTEDYVNQTIEKKNEFIQLDKDPVNADIVRYTNTLKEANVNINYCCTDSPEDISKLFEYGVDFVLVNELGKMKQAMKLSVKKKQ